MKKMWGWIVGAFSVLLGLFFYERSSRKKAESINKLNKLNTDLSLIQKDIDANNKELGIEQVSIQKQKDLLEKASREKLSNEDIADFINRRK